MVDSIQTERLPGLHPLTALNSFEGWAFSKVGIDPMIDGAFIGVPPSGEAVGEKNNTHGQSYYG